MKEESKERRRLYMKEYLKRYAHKKQQEAWDKKRAPLPNKKVCSRCEKEKTKDDFRIRLEKRADPPFEYLNNTCRTCDADLQKINYRKSKEKNRAKNAAKSRAYYQKHKDDISEKQKQKRQTPKYKAYVKEYYQKNKPKIQEQHRAVCKKGIDEMRDWYIVSRIMQKEIGPVRDLIKSNKDLIELKRLQITLKRNINNERTAD